MFTGVAIAVVVLLERENPFQFNIRNIGKQNRLEFKQEMGSKPSKNDVLLASTKTTNAQKLISTTKLNQ